MSNREELLQSNDEEWIPLVKDLSGCTHLASEVITGPYRPLREDESISEDLLPFATVFDDGSIQVPVKLWGP